MQIDAEKIAVFPYRKPWSGLPWIDVVRQPPAIDQWVWVSDRLCNIYPAVRTLSGWEVPTELSMHSRVQAGLLDRPLRWLPLDPHDLILILEGIGRA